VQARDAEGRDCWVLLGEFQCAPPRAWSELNALAQAVLSFGIQRKFIEMFLIKSVVTFLYALSSPSRSSKRITGLSPSTLFGYKVPFSISTCQFTPSHQNYSLTPPPDATLVFLSHQITLILKFFLARNISIARERVWAQTIASRGKGPDFWGPYVEEWDTPPLVDVDEAGVWGRFLKSWFGRFVIIRGESRP
jgi:hypothetical protein